MNSSVTPTIKIAILVVFAIIFATTLVALSVRVSEDSGRSEWGRSFTSDRFDRFDRDTRKISESFAVQQGAALRVNTDLGDVRVRGGDADSVLVTVNVRGREQDVEDFVVKFNQTAQGVEVRARYRDNEGWDFDWHDFDAQFDIVVPREFNLKLETSGGDIGVTDIRGMIGGGTSGGDINLTGITGDVRLETSGGDIVLKEVTGTIATETSGGDIDGTTLTGDVNVETSGGDIDLRAVKGKTVASTSGGNVRVELLENLGIDVSTSGGNIVVRLPGAASADIEAESHSGSVNCDFPILGKLDDGSLHGTINGGGPKLKAETSGGNISIRKKD